MYTLSYLISKQWKLKIDVFFVDNPIGIGKTSLYRFLLVEIRSNRMIALATATYNLVASIIPGDWTSHSRFNIPL